jgi:ubiquinone/menaquinone biosynthesis C-methylase UbiE
MLTPQRIYQEELLDLGAGTDDDVAGNLIDLRRINRFLGGTRVVMRGVMSKLDGQAEISLLDVGTGSADIPAAVASQCRSRRIEPMVAALDLSERNLRLARARLGAGGEIALIRADALKLPFSDRSFDFVTASLFLHHFHEDEIVELLRDFARVARISVIISDLVRNLLPYYFTRMAGPVLALSRLTRNDAPLSVLRGFTANELRALAQQAGLRSFKLERVFPYRLSLIADVSER